MNNLVVQLLLRTGTFSNDLKTAGGQVQSFKKGCQTAGNTLTQFGKSLGINVGALGKFGGAVGAAVVAGKELKAIIDSNQTSADAFQGVIAGCTGVIDTFNQAMATADFSAFRDGLWSIYDAAKAARDALDDLQDASLAYGYLSKENRTKFNDAYNMFKDPEATEDMKEAAKAQMKETVEEQWELARAIGKKEMDAYVTQVIKEAGSANLSASNVTTEQFKKAQRIKLGVDGDTKKLEAENERKYREYLAKMKEYGKNNIAAQEKLKKEYADVISVRAIIKGMNDKELEQVVQIVGAMEDAKQDAQSMEKTMNRLMNPGKNNKSGGSSSLRNELVVQKESLEYWNKLAQEAKKHRDAEVFNSDAWNEYNNALNMAETKMEEINEQLAKMKREQQQLKYENLLTPVSGPNLTGQVTNTNPGGLATGEGTKRSVNELNALIQKYTELRDNLKEGDSMIEFYNKRIAELGVTLENIKGVGVKAPDVKKETINSWDEFSNAMANTSTIVSSLTNTFKEGAEVTASSILSMVATALPALGSLISSIEALTTAEAVEAGVAATGKAVSSSKHWVEAIAAVAALGSVVAAALSAAKSQRYANGGIVGGNSFTGDRVTANVNSGEMILNKQQQARLFRIANGSNNQTNKEVTFHISGTELVGVLNNVNRKNKVIR